MSNIVAILLDNLQKIDMSVYEFSKRVGIPKGRIYQWIRGNGSPKAEDVKLIEAFLGKEIDQPNMTTLTGKPNFQVKQVADEKDKIIKEQRETIIALQADIKRLEQVVDKLLQKR